jgi:MFS family permease
VFATFRRLERRARLLIAARMLRSVAQGALVVDFTLYLRALAWPATHIGAIMAAGLLLGVTLTLAIGPLSDRVGRKKFLLAYEAVQFAAAAMAVTTSTPLWLSLAAVAGSFGRGGNGATGPFAPIEQAWLATDLSSTQLLGVFRLNAAVGFFGMGVGALFAMVPRALSTWLPGPLAYRPVFALAAVAATLCFALVKAIDEPRRAAAPQARPREQRRAEGRRLLRLMNANALNGFAIGMVGPFIAYWFHIRFGVGPVAIGPVMALGFGLAGLSTIASGRMMRRLGPVDTVIALRLLGLVFLALLPFAPSYGIAAALHVLRSAANRATAGARQALTLELVDSERRGLAASLSTAATQIPRAIGPVLGGWMFDADLLAAPFVIAGMLQAGYLLLYRRLFRGRTDATIE